MAQVLQREKKIKILIFYSLQRNEDFVHFLSCIQFLYKRTFLSDEQIYYHILHVTATTVNHPEFESGAHAFYPSSLFWEGEFRWREESFSPPPFLTTPLPLPLLLSYQTVRFLSNEVKTVRVPIYYAPTGGRFPPATERMNDLAVLVSSIEWSLQYTKSYNNLQVP